MKDIYQRTVDNLISILLIAIMAAVFVTSGDFPTSAAGGPGAGFFPQFVSGVIILLSLALLIKNNVLQRQEQDPFDISVEKVSKFIIPAALMIGYLVLLPYLGFIVASLAFSVVLMRYSGVELYRKSVPISAAVVILLQFVFGSFLGVYLPQGIEPISQMTSLLPILVIL